MTDETRNDHWSLIERLLEVVSKLPQLGALGDARQAVQKLLQRSLSVP
jgi:hypothetical protein